MKNLLFMALFIVAAITGCNSKKQCEISQEPSICGKWELTKINDNSVSPADDSENAYIIFNLKDSTIAAFDGCNNIGGFVVKADSGNLVMVDMASTLQFCPEQGESAMLGTILNVADKYEIKECAEHGEFLIISSSTDSVSATFKKFAANK